MPPPGRKLFTIAIPAATLAALVSLVLVEAWVRSQWDDRRGTPGFYLSDPVLGQRLRPGYVGFFAGVPVHINALGFRDTREYQLEKSASTFRILVLGDSVTFGHGTSNETTYPFLLDRQLAAWRPDVRWEVWNLGVPGYNTSQELAYLKLVEHTYTPDLVVVGFYENDLYDNRPLAEPGLVRRATSALQRTAQRYLYSYELYKRIFLTARWRLLPGTADRQRLDELAGEEALLARIASGATDRQMSEVDHFDDQQVSEFTCREVDTNPTRDRLAHRLRAGSAEISAWTGAVRGFQEKNHGGRSRVVFFLNMAPADCTGSDRFYDDGSIDDEQALRDLLGDLPTGASTRAFLHYRPSQMPGAGGHSTGNANHVKAAALFDFLSAEVLPALLRPSAVKD